jgi:hypothetical protein
MTGTEKGEKSEKANSRDALHPGCGETVVEPAV